MIATSAESVDCLLEWFKETRKTTVALCQPLQIEDHVVQSSPDVSPPSWHLGHTTWFFETFLLRSFAGEYGIYDSAFSFLFNSYYEAEGARIQKINRGVLSRPGVAEIHNYRESVDAAMDQLFGAIKADQIGDARRILDLTELGIHHEKQHQELLLMDIKHIFFSNPMNPRYVDSIEQMDYFNASAAARGWVEKQDPLGGNAYRRRELDAFSDSGCPERGGLLFGQGGLAAIGATGPQFSYDNERPNHTIYQSPFWIASQPVTNGEYLEFIESGGYSDFRHWLSAGWQWVCENEIQHPMYWRKLDDTWQQWSLCGWIDLDPSDFVSHLSFYEADAFARFRNARLPLESEWEIASIVAQERELPFASGHVWEWTGSAYRPYPGFMPAAGAVGEYNAKFMVDQMVLRGGCHFTPADHTRATYRNFYPAGSRWQMSGLRLAEDA